MFLSFLATFLIFTLVCAGVAWPLVARIPFAAAEKLLASAALSLLGAFLIAWTIYVAALPVTCLWILPVVALAGIAGRWPEFSALWRDPSVRAIAAGQVIVSAWCLGWLATIASYSGGGWAGDWYEHWERTRFFLERWPLDSRFIAQYTLTARPPLANVVTAAILAITRPDFAHYQLVTALFSSLAYLPAAVLALRWRGVQAVALLAVLAMVNPLFVQNATFAWTKLPAAFFVLTALYFFLRARETNPTLAAPAMCAAALAAAALTHYSAGPYLVVLALAWVVHDGAHRIDRPRWRATTVMAGIGTLLLATWFGWSLAVYGVHDTFLTNSSVTASDARHGNQLVKIALNFVDTVVPHFLRPLEVSLIAQRSPWGALRDWFFQCYQINLPLAFGSVAWLAIAYQLVRGCRCAAPRDRIFWGAFIAGAVVLGIATHGQRDHWGLAHICLQALVVLGLAYLAAQWTALARGWRVALIVGAAVDLVFGIALHFGVQSYMLDRWLAPGRKPEDVLTSYNGSALMNLQGKITHRLTFVSDAANIPFGMLLAVLTGLLLLGILRAARTLRSTPGDGMNLADATIPAPTSVHPAAPSPRLLAIISLAVIGCALAHLWTSWCAFPISSWNETRLAPAFTLRFGGPLYPALGQGPLSTWIYGPIGAVINLPATLGRSVVSAIETAGAINILIVVVPLAVVCFGSSELRHRGRWWQWLALAIAILLQPADTLVFQVADNAAIACGLLSSWYLARESIPRSRHLFAAALLCTLAIWSKQLAVFLPVAQLIFLWSRGHRGAAIRYLVWLTALGAATLVLAGLVFGWGNFWLNLVEIPARLPWSEIHFKLDEHWRWLLLYVVLPLAVVAGLRAARCWPARDCQAARFLHCGIIAFMTLLPIGLMAFFKVGGSPNVLHSWYYVAAPAVIAGIARCDWLQSAGQRAVLAAIGVLCVARIFQCCALPMKPVIAHLEQAERLALAGAGTTWFPNNPLVTFYADRKFYHQDDGIMIRNLARLPLGGADLRRHLPARLRAIAYPTIQTAAVGLMVLPEFNQRTVVGDWALYQRGQSDPVAGKSPLEGSR